MGFASVMDCIFEICVSLGRVRDASKVIVGQVVTDVIVPCVPFRAIPCNRSFLSVQVLLGPVVDVRPGRSIRIGMWSEFQDRPVWIRRGVPMSGVQKARSRVDLASRR